MIELVSVELTNFRSFTHAHFQPAAIGEGLTAIVGDNGSGKTSIVTALLWCLYGTTPNGVTVKSLRKQNTDEPVIVTVTFHHNNQTVTVERSLRGNQDKTVARITVDGQAQTEISSRTATNWIVKRTGLNAESFTSAFVVQQKELDSLVKARPAERRKTVERLAGIERMSQAITLAKEENKTRQTVLSTHTPSTINTTANNATITELTKQNTELTKQKTLLTEQKTEHETQLAHITETLKKVRTATQQRTDLTHQIAMLDTKIASEHTMCAQHDRIIENAKKLSENHTLRSVETVEEGQIFLAEQLSEQEQLAKKIVAATERHNTLAETVTRTETQLAQKTQQNETLQLKNLQLTKQISDLPPLEETRTTRTTLTRHIQELNEQAAVTKNNITIDEDALELMKQHTHDTDPSCPTCLNPIKNYKEVIQKFETKLTQEREELATIEEKIAHRKTKLTETEKLLTATETLYEKQREISYRIGSNDIEMLDITTLLAEQSDKYDTSAETLHQLTTKHPNLTETINTTKTELEHITETLYATEEAHQAQTKKQHNLTTITQLETQKKHLTDQLNQLDQTDTATYQTENLETETENLRNRITETTNTINTIATTILTNTTTITQLENDNHHHQQQQKIFEKAQLDAETSATTVATLEAFRKDRLARLTPELSEITTDLLTEMTNGKYVLVEFDDDFTPYVTTDTGETRPVTWLSGGEESLVALSLRIAIGEILAGGRNGNLLILDEVLTAQDRTRRNATLTAIRGLDRQTIVVNHIEESTDVVDKITYVTQAPENNPDEGSTLT